MSLALKKITPLPVGNESGKYDGVTLQHNGLRSVTRQWEVEGGSEQSAEWLNDVAKSLFDDYGTLDGKTSNTSFDKKPDSQKQVFPNCYLEEQGIKSKDPKSSSAILTKRYQEAYSTFRDIQKPLISTDDRGRKTTQRTMVILNDSAPIGDSIGTPHPDFSDQVYTKQVAEEGNAVTIVKRDYVQATSQLEEIGDAVLSIDENNRHGTVRTYTILNSAGQAAIDGVLGTPDVEFPNQVYVSQVAQQNGVTTTVRRTFLEATATLEEVSDAEFSIDKNNRRETLRTYIVLNSAGQPLIDGTLGTPDVEFPSQVYFSQTVKRNATVSYIRRTFTEATSQLIQVGGDRLDTEVNGLLRCTQIYVGLAGAPLGAGDVGVDSIKIGSTVLYLAGVTQQPNAVTNTVSKVWMEAGLLDVDRSFQEGGLLLVTFKAAGIAIRPTALNAAYTLSDDPSLAHQGGAEAPLFRNGIRDTSGYRTYVQAVLLNINGSAVENGDVVSSREEWVQQAYPGVVTVSTDKGIEAYSGSNLWVKALVEETLSTTPTIAGTTGRPFEIVSGAYAQILFKPTETGVSQTTAKGFSAAYLGAEGALIGQNTEFLGQPVRSVIGSVVSNPTYQGWLAASGVVLSSTPLAGHVTDEGVRWYRRRTVTLIGSFSDYLN